VLKVVVEVLKLIPREMLKLVPGQVRIFVFREMLKLIGPREV